MSNELRGLEMKFHVLRARWKQNLLGVEESNLEDPDIKKIVEETAEKAEAYWNSMDKLKHRSFLWQEFASENISGHITECYIRLKQMSTAYYMAGSSLKGNGELLRDIIRALDWLYENRYNENSNYYDNWWPWDIGIPLRLNDIVVLLYEELSEKQINNYMRAIEKFSFDPTVCRADKIKTTGANRVDMCKVAAVSGIILKRGDLIKIANESLREVFQYVTEEDGFYKDGSFVQHGAIPYTCSYGSVLIEGLSVMLQLLSNSPWEINYPEVNNIYNWIYDSYEPLIYKGAAMDMTRGRAVSRYFLRDHVIGHEIISSILRLSTFAPEPHASKFKSMVKYWVLSDTGKSFYSDIDAVSIASAKMLIKDSKVLPKEELIGHFHFANMDRVVHRAPGYAFAISMYSKRIQNYEDMNDENKKAWYTSDGMTYLYNNDLNHYSEDFWPTVNPYRIAGTTVDTAERQVVLQKHGFGGQRKSSKSWVGGVTLAGLYGAAGMELESGFSTLTAKKSWFMFQKEIVALGAGISSSDNRNIETIIENRRLEHKGENALVIDGKYMPCDLGWTVHLDNVKWMHLEGSNAGADIGYYFPDSANIEGLREKRYGCWKDINVDGTSNRIGRNYLTLWLNHGLKPVDEGYSYVILPNKSAEQIKCYAEKPEIIIMENSKELQAVKNTRLNIIAANLWEDRERCVDYISCNKKASFMALEKDNKLEFSISDPTMENQGTIEVVINRVVKGVESMDEGIEVKREENYLKLIINVKDARGRAFNIKLLL